MALSLIPLSPCTPANPSGSTSKIYPNPTTSQQSITTPHRTHHHHPLAWSPTVSYSAHNSALPSPSHRPRGCFGMSLTQACPQLPTLPGMPASILITKLFSQAPLIPFGALLILGLSDAFPTIWADTAHPSPCPLCPLHGSEQPQGPPYPSFMRCLSGFLLLGEGRTPVSRDPSRSVLFSGSKHPGQSPAPGGNSGDKAWSPLTTLHHILSIYLAPTKPSERWNCPLGLSNMAASSQGPPNPRNVYI